jgi:hypothetical protein
MDSIVAAVRVAVCELAARLDAGALARLQAAADMNSPLGQDVFVDALEEAGLPVADLWLRPLGENDVLVWVARNALFAPPAAPIPVSPPLMRYVLRVDGRPVAEAQLARLDRPRDRWFDDVPGGITRTVSPRVRSPWSVDLSGVAWIADGSYRLQRDGIAHVHEMGEGVTLYSGRILDYVATVDGGGLVYGTGSDPIARTRGTTNIHITVEPTGDEAP